MKKSYFLVEIESEYEVKAETLQSNIYYRFPTSVESVKVEAVEQPPALDVPCTCPKFENGSKVFPMRECEGCRKSAHQ